MGGHAQIADENVVIVDDHDVWLPAGAVGRVHVWLDDTAKKEQVLVDTGLVGYVDLIGRLHVMT